ncbi:MAG TPA: hypothetical protein VGF99_01130, partial [Myxococcota bacterium]
PAQAGPGAPIGGIILSSLGGVVTVAGGVALGLGLVPYIDHAGGAGAQDAAAAKYADADNAFDRRQAAGEAADAYDQQRGTAQAWNTQGRWLAVGGGVGVAAGIGMLVGGILLVANNGPAVDNDVDDDGEDDRSDRDVRDDRDERDQDDDEDEER